MKKIEIKKLFGRFDYCINLHEDGLTILTGPNGYGKSTILKMIEYLSMGLSGFIRLINIDFEALCITFCDDTILDIKNGSDRITIDEKSIKRTDLTENLFKNVFRRYPVSTIDDDIVYDRRLNKKYTIEKFMEKILEEYGEYERESLLFNCDLPAIKRILEKLDKVKSKIGKIYFVKEQRLIKQVKERSESKAINVIEEIPEKIISKINKASSNYSSVASKLDGSYPNRLFKNDEKIEKDEFEEKLNSMQEKWNKLAKYNLSSIEQLTDTAYKPEHAKALKIYFEDFDLKYNEYRSLIEEFELFEKIVNSRLNFKQIRIVKDKGIEVLDNNLNILKLEDLSSGEKQVIVLFYELLFETDNQSLLLIDEPEISLHIVWQQMFMNDLLEITSMKKLNAIVATHSPQIISDHWERQIDLGELYDRKLG